ncbi:MAG: cysteine--tRNA ligase [Candidatus Woesearchaeota archaeon]|jgi:cysteinyl-tRNA synthetase|nr:cysteine--tRNA ligase [Candidatus Woesearchaeota archaeon]MDP7323841.1 cysteine--tRNA ligase [Candidatus Woesearchaeota archaeon]
MALKFYNTLTRRKDSFKPLKKNQVSLYSCGPTVYDYAHIGNFRSYIFVDILKKYLEFKGFKVKHIMNITDIDDKTIRDSKEANLSLKEFTEKFTDAFFKDLTTLNIKEATKFPKATDHVDGMIKVTKALVDKGYAYEKNGSVYFAINKFKDYGKLSKVDLSQQKAGARVDSDEYEKDHPGDFALLKKSTEDEINRNISYDSDWGKVRPGWHIECTIMSMNSLGPTFDIHTGGVDLIFPHHENEITQSEAYTEKKFVNYWLHCEHLIVDGKKMSKSLGNFYTLRDVIKKDFDPLSVRYLLLATNYRQQLNFTFEGLKSAHNSIERLNNFIFSLKNVKGTIDNPAVTRLIDQTKTKFERKMDDDLSISEALAVIFNFTKDINKLIDTRKISKKNADSIIKLLKELDSVLGVMNFKKEEKTSSSIQDLLDKRESARKNKDFKTADELRDKIKEKGYIIEDSDDGPRVKKID